MFRKFSFTLRQAIYNVRKSLMTILTLALAISMIAGLFYYFDAFERDALRSSSQFDMVSDFTLAHSRSTQSLNCSSTFAATDTEVLETFASTDLDVDEVFRYQMITSRRIAIVNPSPFELLRFTTFQFDEVFYNSQRFSQFYEIVEGDVPKNPNEILVDYIVALKMNWEVNTTRNLTTGYQHDFSNNYFVDIPNITIVGTYIPHVNFDRYRIVNNTVTYKNNYYELTEEEIDELQTREDVEDFDNYPYEHPILTYSNFESNDHPFQLYYQDLNETLGELDIPREFIYVSGYGINLNRDFTSFFNMVPPSTSIAQHKEVLIRRLPRYVILSDMISEPLNELFQTSRRLRVFSQIINIPILIVAIIIGSFAAKSATQNKIDEFLLLRSKGVSKRMVRNQIFMESVVNGVLASILGSGLGFATFFGHDIWIRPMVYTQFIALDVTLFAKQTSILLALGLGVLLSMFTSISSMIYVSKLKTSELLTAIGKAEMDIEFDEQSVYKATSKSSKAMRKARRIHKREYKDNVDEQQKKIKKSSIALLLISFIPLYFFLFLVLLQNSNIPWIRTIVDYFRTAVDQVPFGPSGPQFYINPSMLYGFLTLFLVTIVPLLVVGIIRTLTIEAPKFFARISRFLGRIFLREKSYLLGLQMIKKKQYATVILLLGAFTAIFVHLNVMTYSSYTMDNMYYNYEVGTDIRKATTFDSNLTNSGDVDDFLQHVQSIKTMEGTPLIEDALVYYRHRSKSNTQLYNNFVDLSAYINLMEAASEKMLPDNDFLNKIISVIEFNLMDPYGDGIPGAIVNERYLSINQYEIGQVVGLEYWYYDSRLPVDTAFQNGYTLPIRIIAVAEYFPGVYVRLVDGSSLHPAEFVVVDVASLPFQGIDYMLHAPQIRTLIEIDKNVETDVDVVEDILDNNTRYSFNPFYSSDYLHYDQNWRTIQKDVTESINPLLVYKMGYLIFIVVLIQVALGLPILLTSVRKKEQHFYGILLSRGFGKKGIFRFITSELFVIYFFSIIGGFLAGLLSSSLFLLLGTKTNPYQFGLKFRLFFNPLDILAILGVVVGLSLIIFLVEFLISTRKSISEYLYKF